MSSRVLEVAYRYFQKFVTQMLLYNQIILPTHYVPPKCQNAKQFHSASFEQRENFWCR